MRRAADAAGVMPTATLSSLVAQESPHARDYADALAEVASAACQPASRRCGSSATRPSPPQPSSSIVPRVVLGSSPPVAQRRPSTSAPFARATRRYLLTARPAYRARGLEKPQKGVDELLAEWTP